MHCLKQEHKSERQGSASPTMVIVRHVTTFGLCSLQATKHVCAPCYQLMGYSETANATSMSEEESRRWIKIMISLTSCNVSSILQFFSRHNFYIEIVGSEPQSSLFLCAFIRIGERISCHFNTKDLGMAAREMERDTRVHLSPQVMFSNLHIHGGGQGLGEV